MLIKPNTSKPNALQMNQQFDSERERSEKSSQNREIPERERKKFHILLSVRNGV